MTSQPRLTRTGRTAQQNKIDWQRRRDAGESVADIARDVGYSETHVASVTTALTCEWRNDGTAGGVTGDVMSAVSAPSDDGTANSEPPPDEPSTPKPNLRVAGGWGRKQDDGWPDEWVLDFACTGEIDGKQIVVPQRRLDDSPDGACPWRTKMDTSRFIDAVRYDLADEVADAGFEEPDWNDFDEERDDNTLTLRCWCHKADDADIDDDERETYTLELTFICVDSDVPHEASVTNGVAFVFGDDDDIELDFSKRAAEVEASVKEITPAEVQTVIADGGKAFRVADSQESYLVSAPCHEDAQDWLVLAFDEAWSVRGYQRFTEGVDPSGAVVDVTQVESRDDLVEHGWMDDD